MENVNVSDSKEHSRARPPAPLTRPRGRAAALQDSRLPGPEVTTALPAPSKLGAQPAQVTHKGERQPPTGVLGGASSFGGPVRRQPPRWTGEVSKRAERAGAGFLRCPLAVPGGSAVLMAAGLCLIPGSEDW